MNEMKHFDCHFDVKTVGVSEDDANIGVFEGYASTFGNTDRVDDVIVRGAFAKTLKDHQGRKRQIRMLSQHDRYTLIGGFPSDDAFEDERGLFVKGNINLDTQSGRESFALMKQGVLEDMSIGFITRDSEMSDGKQMIKEVDLFEISLVTEPANQEAQITAIKAVVPFQNLPLADVGRAWDSDAALGRVRELTGSEDGPSDTYRKAFLWYDRANADEFGAYKLPIATVVDGRMVAVPRGIFAAAAAIQGARGGVFIPEADRPGVIRNIERYYEKMDRESPFEKGFSPDEIKGLARGDLVAFMRSGPTLSKNGAEFVASKIYGGPGKQVADKQADGLRLLKETLTQINPKEKKDA